MFKRNSNSIDNTKTILLALLASLVINGVIFSAIASPNHSHVASAKVISQTPAQQVQAPTLPTIEVAPSVNKQADHQQAMLSQPGVAPEATLSAYQGEIKTLPTIVVHPSKALLQETQRTN